jgi:hypothetical protein
MATVAGAAPTSGAPPPTPYQEDQARLCIALIKFLGLPPIDIRTNPVVLALNRIGVYAFNLHFTTLSKNDFETLVQEDPANPGNMIPLQTHTIRLLQVLLAIYHYVSRLQNRSIDILDITENQFDTFRVRHYDHEDPIVPWGNPLPAKMLSKEQLLLENWKKNTRPTRSDYKEFKDESFWHKWKEHFLTTVDAHNLTGTIDSSRRVAPEEKELDFQQRKWLYKILQDILKTSKGKQLIAMHMNDKNTREIWRKLVEHYDKSMTSELRAQTLSSYITSTRFHNLAWRGSQSNFIFHFWEQLRLYNEISKVPYTDEQQVQFLRNCLAGTKGLCDVYQTSRQSRLIMGVTDPLTFDTYVMLLLDVAAQHDSANTSTYNPRSKRSANIHDVSFEDGTTTTFEETVSDLDYSANNHEFHYNVNVHDIDTPVEVLQAYQTSQQSSTTSGKSSEPSPTRLDAVAWKALSDADKKHWIGMSQDGKITVLTYGARNQRRYILGSNPNSAPRYTPRSANTHEQEVSPEVPQESEPVTSPQLEVSNHDITPPSILDMATSKTTGEKAKRGHITINSIMSTKKSAPRTVSTHEQKYIKRSPYTLEVNVHRRREILGRIMEYDDSDTEEESAPTTNVTSIFDDFARDLAAALPSTPTAATIPPTPTSPKTTTTATVPEPTHNTPSDSTATENLQNPRHL